MRENNPILLKPTVGGIEVIFMGEPLGVLKADEYYSSIESYWQRIKHVIKKEDIVEGAGGMGEPNFLDRDITVHRVASELKANIVLVLDIDRGGAFASAYGTYLMSPPSVRERMKGFIINKFRGDEKLLEPAISWLEGRTGMKYLGVIRYDEEFLMMPEDSMNVYPFGDGELDVGVVAYPYMSNFNEVFALMKSNSSVRFVRKRREVERSDVIILPGTRNTVESLRWLKERGLDEVLKRKPVIGICGGFQMMGSRLIDKAGLESGNPGEYQGMGIFDFNVIYGDAKVISQSSAMGGQLSGYEIRRGEIVYNGSKPLYVIEKRNNSSVRVEDGAMEGNKLGLSVHGFMFSPQGKKILSQFGIQVTSGSLEQEVEEQVSSIEKKIKGSLDVDQLDEIYKS